MDEKALEALAQLTKAINSAGKMLVAHYAEFSRVWREAVERDEAPTERES